MFYIFLPPTNQIPHSLSPKQLFHPFLRKLTDVATVLFINISPQNLIKHLCGKHTSITLTMIHFTPDIRICVPFETHHVNSLANPPAQKMCRPPITDKTSNIIRRHSGVYHRSHRDAAHRHRWRKQTHTCRELVLFCVNVDWKMQLHSLHFLRYNVLRERVGGSGPGLRAGKRNHRVKNPFI